MRKALKYQETIDNQNLSIECPNGCSEKNVKAFRWVFEDVNHEENFLPRIFTIGPKRRNELSDEGTCLSCGLSFYGSYDSAINNFQNMPPKIQKKIQYTNIAEGTLNEEDGVASDENNAGHFTFYEYYDANLFEKFEIAGAL